MDGKYKVITLCGSTRFKDAFIEAQKRLTLEGNIVISVGLFGHSGDQEVWDGMDEGTLSKTKEMLDDMHKRKIDMADAIYVINVGGYIGESTQSEIEYAKKHGKEIRYLEEQHASADDEKFLLSEDAMKILGAAAGHVGGYVRKTSAPPYGPSLQEGLTVLSENVGWNDITRIDEAFEELLKVKFIHKVDREGLEYQITYVGIEYWDNYWVVPVLFKMSYDEYCNSLLEKYGVVPGNYFIGLNGFRNNSITRTTEDGLFIHHMDEDKIPGLSKSNLFQREPYVSREYQMYERLVYCNYVEHLLLHMKIIEKELTITVDNRNQDYPVGISGFDILVGEIDRILSFSWSSNKTYLKRWEERAWKELSGRWINIFLKTIKYFVENIETRNDFEKWYGIRMNLKKSLKNTHRIYKNHPIEYNESIRMEEYNRGIN